jgi:hypothetical protein
MWIQNTDPETYPTESFSDEYLTDGETVEFTENWTANVSEDVADRLVEEVDHIEPYDADDDVGDEPTSDTNDN